MITLPGWRGGGYSDTFIYSDQFWGFKILHFNIIFVFLKNNFILFFFGGGGGMKNISGLIT